MAFSVGSRFDVGKFEMHCLHRDLQRRGKLATAIYFMGNHLSGYFVLQTINTAHSFVIFFDAMGLLNIFSLMYRFVFAVGFNLYFDDITVTTFLSFHLTKAILALSLITISDDALSSFSIFFTGFNCAFSTLFNQTVLVAALSFSLSSDAVIEDFI